jgi:OOP family OmpA-OmpF porin
VTRRPRLLALPAVLMITGCSSLSVLSETTSTAVPHCGPPQSMELIIGAHRNAPAPRLAPRLQCRVAAAVQAGKPVRIVVASGQPSFIQLRLQSVQGGTIAQQNSPRAQHDVGLIEAAVGRATPHSPGVDDLGALSEAADDARSIGVPRAELVLIDSGLDDRGALDFTVPGLVAATPREVVAQLRAAGELPHVRGDTVVLVGIGYTAQPQAPLSAKWRSNVTQIWAAVIRAAGARVQIIPQPALGGPVRTDQPVRAVAVPAAPSVKPRKHTTITFTGASPVRFSPSSTAFAEPAAARRALAPIARWLAARPGRHASLEGTTADVGPLAGQIALSRQRADRVRAQLIGLGAPAAQLTTTGVGSRFPQFTPDRGAHHALLAGPATLNRSVRITLS